MKRSLIPTIKILLLSVLTTFSVTANPVVPGGRIGVYTHGKYPSWGERTHAGVDILAAENSDIYAFADGKVVDIQHGITVKGGIVGGKQADCVKNLNTGLGNMVLIEHFPLSNGKIFYTIYLHLKTTPSVNIGDDVFAGKTVIGKIGRTGSANCTPHTHFEIRYFSTRLHKSWNNVYGNGDQSGSEIFKRDWEDPLDFFAKYPSGMSNPTNLPKPLPAPKPSASEVPTLFLFDVSGSMNENDKIGQARASSLMAMRQIQENKRLGRGETSVSVWTFSGDCVPGAARQVLPFTSNLIEAENTLRAKIPLPDGGTPLPQGIEKATTQISAYLNRRPELGEGRIILLSDGQSTCGEIRPAGVYSQAKTVTVKKVRFLTIGFDVPPGSAAERDLQYLASASGGQYFPAQNRQQLARAFEKTIRIYLPKTTANASPEFENVVNAITNRDFQRARKFAAEYLRKNPSDAFGYYNLAVSLEALSLYKGAAEHYRNYLQFAPDAEDRRETEARIAKLEQDWRDQFFYYQKLLQSDLDYLKAFYGRIFNREIEKNAAEFAGFVSKKQGFYANLTDILEIRSMRIERDARDLSDSLGVLNRRVGLQSFDRDAVSLLTIPIGHLEDIIERVGIYAGQNLK